MRTSPPWRQHRDLKLCHDLSHYMLQTCLIRNSAPDPTNALEALSRVPIEDGWTALNSTSFSSGAQLVYSFVDPTRYSNREVRTMHKHSLHVATLSGPLFAEGLSVDAIVTPELGFKNRTSSHRHLEPNRKKLTLSAIVAGTPGLVLTHNGNVPQ